MNVVVRRRNINHRHPDPFDQRAELHGLTRQSKPFCFRIQPAQRLET